MADIDYDLYEDTKQNLMDAANGDDELIWMVEEQLQDMKDCGFFDLPKDYDPTDEEDYY